MPTSIKLALIGCALIAGYFAQDIATWLTEDNKMPLSQYCQLSRHACEQEAISVTLSRDIAQPLVPVQISAEWPNRHAETLRLTLNGYEMDMGTALFELKQAKDGLYQAEILLPACTVENMTWVGQLSDGQQSINLAVRMAR
ncbi:hypothetical protein VII00023_06907 [Vibrio ichthyoenteri ATCC 700023]|uniref:Uncharacterized protein n=1 Tax=Vibrio ichthyoenteri ATCC 700023 TaxID=870968 RepID=F9RYY5_9VIBR|nr:hypothetical protein [Vibrio ichthyoenteri]EGU46247.1 hypothetical protein VII00023_06907 [Vibrio ichthyoenteri ATCC 700023]